jgi:hypothetical protein
MAEKQGKLHVCIDEIENGYEVSCYRDKKPSLSQKAGWIPSSYEPPKKYSFKTMKEALAHVSEESGDKK